jgi:hypothetical protein
MVENESTPGPGRPAPGLVKRPDYMRDVHGKSDGTGKRWQAPARLWWCTLSGAGHPTSTSSRPMRERLDKTSRDDEEARDEGAR